MDEIPLGVSAGGVSEEGGSESGAGSRWVDSSDDEGGQGVQEDAGDSGGGRGVRGSGTAVGGDGLKGGRKSLDSEGTATAGGEEERVGNCVLFPLEIVKYTRNSIKIGGR